MSGVSIIPALILRLTPLSRGDSGVDIAGHATIRTFSPAQCRNANGQMNAGYIPPIPVMEGGEMEERDIIDRLLDFECCGLTALDRVNIRECAAIEIHKLRRENERFRKALEIIAGSSDRLQALQAVGALHNIGPAITSPASGSD